MTAMDAAVGAVALACVFAGVLVARIGLARARQEGPDVARASRYGGLVLMAVGLFFTMNVSLWLILPAFVVAEVARRLSHRAGA
jgi:hypothetical protein